MYSLRPANAADAMAIKALIRTVRIYPLGLDWRRFVLAISEDGSMIGCGQVKPHADGTYELASIAVVPEQRGQGVARVLIEYLVDAHPGDLYLTCRANLGPLYQKFGFQSLGSEDLPPYFRRLKRLSGVLMAVHLMPEDILVMRRARAAAKA